MRKDFQHDVLCHCPSVCAMTLSIPRPKPLSMIRAWMARPALGKGSCVLGFFLHIFRGEEWSGAPWYSQVKDPLAPHFVPDSASCQGICIIAGWMNKLSKEVPMSPGYVMGLTTVGVRNVLTWPPSSIDTGEISWVLRCLQREASMSANWGRESSAETYLPLVSRLFVCSVETLYMWQTLSSSTESEESSHQLACLEGLSQGLLSGTEVHAWLSWQSGMLALMCDRWAQL